MNQARPALFRRAIWVTVQIAVSVAAIVLVVRGLDLQATLDAFRDANYWLLIPAIVFLILDLQLRAVRWRLLLSPQKGLSHGNLFGASNVGYLVNSILPFRAGEVVRVLVVDELEDTGVVRAASSVVVERGIDLVMMVVLVVALFPFIDEPSWARGPAILLGACIVAGFVLLAVLARMRESGAGFWRPWLRRVPKAGDRLEVIAEHTLDGFEPLTQPAIFGSVTLLTGALWVCAGLSFYCVMEAFRLNLGLDAAFLVLGATTLGMVIPSSPGYVGVFEAIVVRTLASVFGVADENALTYAVAQHAVIVVIPSLLGVMFLLQRRSLIADVVASARRAVLGGGGGGGEAESVPAVLAAPEPTAVGGRAEH